MSLIRGALPPFHMAGIAYRLTDGTAAGRNAARRFFAVGNYHKPTAFW
jgi:hypothetical protein